MTNSKGHEGHKQKEDQMSQLTYWKVSTIDDSSFAYSCRFKTKAEAFKFWETLYTVDSTWWPCGNEYRRSNPVGESYACKYTAPKKITIEYEGGVFGLLEEIATENCESY